MTLREFINELEKVSKNGKNDNKKLYFNDGLYRTGEFHIYDTDDYIVIAL